MRLRVAIKAIALHIDRFVLALVGVVLAATLFPCHGTSASVFKAFGIVAIATLFFLQGVRLSREAIVSGITHWRLHAVIAGTTFISFPITGFALSALFPTLLPPLLWLGVLFACALPSTVQSSIALTSLAKGNVAGAVCSAAASNLAGIALTPLIFGLLSRVHGVDVHLYGVEQVFCQLLLPFVAGHLLRPRLSTWVENHRSVLSITDRSSILLVVYVAFSGAVEHNVWHQLPPAMLLVLGLTLALVLVGILVLIRIASAALGLCRQDEIAALFCGSQKSLVSGVPIASALFPSAVIGPVLIPIMIYYPLQIVACAWLARRSFMATEANTRLVVWRQPEINLGRGDKLSKGMARAPD